jgi:hypothetical protein
VFELKSEDSSELTKRRIGVSGDVVLRSDRSRSLRKGIVALSASKSQASYKASVKDRARSSLFGGSRWARVRVGVIGAMARLVAGLSEVDDSGIYLERLVDVSQSIASECEVDWAEFGKVTPSE